MQHLHERLTAIIIKKGKAKHVQGPRNKQQKTTSTLHNVRNIRNIIIIIIIIIFFFMFSSSTNMINDQSMQYIYISINIHTYTNPLQSQHLFEVARHVDTLVATLVACRTSHTSSGGHSTGCQRGACKINILTTLRPWTNNNVLENGTLYFVFLWRGPWRFVIMLRNLTISYYIMQRSGHFYTTN